MAAALALRLVHLPYVEIGLYLDVFASHRTVLNLQEAFSVAFCLTGVVSGQP